MNVDEAAALLTHANQLDALVSLNDANVDVWWASLKNQDYAKATWCLQDYYANTTPGRDGRTPSITPPVLRKRIADKGDLVASKNRALEPPAKHTTPNSYRARNHELWDQLVKQGRDDHLSEMVRRGIPLTPGQEEHY